MRYVLAIATLSLVLVQPASAQTVNVIPPSSQWVTDTAGMLTQAERQALSERLRRYADTTSTQIIVVTVPSLDGVPAADYAVELGRRWGVGTGEHDNGAVILVSRDDRQVYIATGYGLEGAVPDVLASRIVRNVIVPNFRQNRFYAGLSEASNIIMEAAAGEYVAEPRAERPAARSLDVASVFVILIIAFFVIEAMSTGRHGGGGNGGRRVRRRRGVPPIVVWGLMSAMSGGRSRGGMGGFGGGGFGGGGFGGFSGGGGSFGGGGAGGSW